MVSGLGGRRERPRCLWVQLGLSCRCRRGCRLLGRLSFFCWGRLFHRRLLGWRSFFGRCSFLRWGGLLHDRFFGCGGLFCRGFFSRCFFCSCHCFLLDQVAKSTSAESTTVKRLKVLGPCGCIHSRPQDFEWGDKTRPATSAGRPQFGRRGFEKSINRCERFAASPALASGQSQERAPPVWYSMTRVSKKLRSFLRSIISLIHGNGFSSFGNRASRPICVARRLAMYRR